MSSYWFIDYNGVAWTHNGNTYTVTQISDTNGLKLWPIRYPKETVWSNAVTWNHSNWTTSGALYPQTGEVEGPYLWYDSASAVIHFESGSGLSDVTISNSSDYYNYIILSYMGTPIIKFENNGSGYTNREPPYGVSIWYDKEAWEWYKIHAITTKSLTVTGYNEATYSSKTRYTATTNKETYIYIEDD